MPPSGSLPLWPDLRRDLQHALNTLPPWLSARQRVRATCQELSRALGVAVGLASFTADSGWNVLGESRDGVAVLAKRLRHVGRPASCDIGSHRQGQLEALQVDGRLLTLVPLSAVSSGASTFAVLEGDWTGAAAELRLLVDGLLVSRPADPRGAVPLTPYGLSRSLATSGDATDALNEFLHAARTVAPSRYASVAMPGPDGTLRVVAANGYPVSIMSTVRIAPGQGLYGEVYRRARPFIGRDVGATAFAPRRRRFRTGACLLVPVTAGARVMAVVALSDPDAGSYSPDDVHRVLALAAPAALALSRLDSEQRATDLARAAAIDQPTGLSNRAHFENRLREEVQRSVRHGTSLSVLVIDVDAFKVVNDQFGHAAGDDIVRGVAEILKRSVRVFDVCARFGGDEFAILMPGSGLDGAMAIAERIRSRIAARQAPLPHTPAVTVSIGVAELATGEDLPAFVERADRALYAAKRAGKNRVVGGPGR